MSHAAEQSGRRQGATLHNTQTQRVKCPAMYPDLDLKWLPKRFLEGGGVSQPPAGLRLMEVLKVSYEAGVPTYQSWSTDYGRL